MAVTESFADVVAKAYATTGAGDRARPRRPRGAVAHDALVQVPLAMLNRHGLVAGATGTGKTKTLQLLAEQLSAAGVPVFAADIKGDLSGLAAPGATDEPRPPKRGRRPGPSRGRPAAFPVEFLALGGIGPGRAAAGDDDRLRPAAAGEGARPQRHPGVSPRPGLPLRRRAPACRCSTSPTCAPCCSYLTRDEGKADLRSSAALSPATAGVILRELIGARGPGRRRVLRRARVRHRATCCAPPPTAAASSACLELRGRAGPAGAVLDVPDVAARRPVPDLPEVGDLDKPKLVFFFDEAHLLFDDASKAFLRGDRRRPCG